MTEKLSKQELRSHLVGLRKSHHRSAEVSSGQCARLIGENIQTVLSNAWSKPQRVASYRPFGSEADPSHVQSLMPSWSWVFPRVNNSELEFYTATDSEDFETNEWGIEEPIALKKDWVDLTSCAAILVPGRGFDRNGHRLGSGKGFYDRALQNYKGLKVGIGFSVQVVNDPLPTEEHDVELDFIVTDRFILELGVSSSR